ncbi:MAG TPA: glycosyltransferase family 39 protein [Sedimentisphaerales bacterium]|nr:glycosyltransferase family 39 protein [Sedimentisphaerales bacterium]
MTKRSSRFRPGHTHDKAHNHTPVLSASRAGKKELCVLVIVAVLVGIPFSLGKYIEFNSPGAFDSGAYVYSAKHVLDGAKLGVEENPGAQSGTLLVNMLGVWLCGFNETGPKTIQAILQAAALVFMFISMRRLFGKLPAAAATIIASIYLSSPLIAKFGNVKEQYMIACMVIGISCLILRELGGKWYFAVLCGGFLAWGPLFKQTGTSAVAAAGLFVLAQPLLRHKTLKQTVTDCALLLAGAAAALAPLYIWLVLYQDSWKLPYAFVWKIITKGSIAAAGGDYVARGRKLISFAQQQTRVTAYYRLLIMPIALAAGAIIIKVARLALTIFEHLKNRAVLRGSEAATADTNEQKFDSPGRKHYAGYERFVLLLAVWWLLDMAFVWISPRSYEQYYLPLNASAAMLGGYLVAVYRDAYVRSIYKTKWTLIGAAGVVCMVIMSWHVFFGIEKSPHSGNLYGEKRRGYVQKLQEISQRKKNNLKASWEVAAEYIQRHSQPEDKIYVWGWVPGIYVLSQRFSASASCATSEMHVISPQRLSDEIEQMLAAFRQKPPKFIVDTHKVHFPWDRPPLELWPRELWSKTRRGLPVEKNLIANYERGYSQLLADKIGPDEAQRFEEMKPFRDFVMTNYRVVGNFGEYVLFQLKTEPEKL